MDLRGGEGRKGLHFLHLDWKTAGRSTNFPDRGSLCICIGRKVFIHHVGFFWWGFAWPSNWRSKIARRLDVRVLHVRCGVDLSKRLSNFSVDGPG